MPISILMPALSPTMSEGNLAKWHVKVGDTVSAGDVIAEIETDKATMEVEAVDEGKVGKIVVAEGSEGVAVNAVIAWLLEEGESEGDIPADGGAPAPAARSLAYLFSRSRISLPALKNGTYFSVTGTLVPVRGLRPTRAGRFFTENAPKPRSSTRSPRDSAAAISSRMALTMCSTSRW